MWGTTLIAYRKDKIQEPERSWDLLWNQRYAGRIMMIDEKYDPIAAALIRSGRDVARASAEHFEEAMQALIQQVEGMDVRYGADLDVMEGLERGNVWAAMC